MLFKLRDVLASNNQHTTTKGTFKYIIRSLSWKFDSKSLSWRKLTLRIVKP